MKNAGSWLVVKSGVLLSCLLIAAVLLLSGCGDGAGNRSVSQVPTVEAAVPERPVVKPQPATAFLKIVMLQDKSSSTESTRTPQAELSHIDSAIALVSRSGGELAFGLINVNSNQSLVRLRIDMPPVAPPKPSEEGNPWEADSEMRAYDEKRAKYDLDLGQWKSKTANDIDTFKSQVAPLLALKADARRTDIFGGLQRASLFLSERELGLTTLVHGCVILISDGEDNVKAPYNALPANTSLLIINGSASLGPIEQLEPQRFENIDAALRFIAASEANGDSKKQLRP